MTPPRDGWQTLGAATHGAIGAWCWLRVFAAPVLAAVIVGGIVFLALQNVLGAVLGATLLAIGIVLGWRLAEHARRSDLLLEYAHGLPAAAARPAAGSAPGAAGCPVGENADASCKAAPDVRQAGEPAQEER